MNNSKLVFVALASLLATACGSEENELTAPQNDSSNVKTQLENAKIKIEEVSKVGFTEVETGN